MRDDETYRTDLGTYFSALVAVATATGTELGWSSVTQGQHWVASDARGRLKKLCCVKDPTSSLTGRETDAGPYQGKPDGQGHDMMRDVTKHAQEVAQDKRLRADLRAALDHGSKASERLQEEHRSRQHLLALGC